MSYRQHFLRYLDCYARKDIAGIAAMLAPGATLRDWNISVQGREAVLEEMQANFEHADSLRIEVLRLYEGSDGVAGELRIVVDGHIELFVVDVIAFDTDAKVTAIRAYKGRGD